MLDVPLNEGKTEHKEHIDTYISTLISRVPNEACGAMTNLLNIWN